MNNPEEVRYSALEQSYQQISDFSDQRNEFIKTSFKNILDSLMNPENKAWRVSFKNCTPTQLKRKFCCKKRILKCVDKDHPDYIESVLAETDLPSPQIVQFIEEYGKDIQSYMKKMASLAQKLVKIRNEILNLHQKGRVWSDYEEVEGVVYSKNDALTGIKMYNKFKSTKAFTPHYIWDIPLKTHNNNLYEDGEMTETPIDQ
ncbi:unnamed protein product [Moneuplotes crassus]|uniref:Uncharacterized protein n=1 Tax=Euplotes crassus TaxID=5936 RepID=A0AAD1XLD5_EUPCR|nr:unnamed protein product [Moneuplotes crassus]